MTAAKEEETIWCVRCGDVKACLHYPDAIVLAAFWNEIANAEKGHKREATKSARRTEQ